MTRFVFIGGTGTAVGKTWLTGALAARARAAGQRVVALKPVETGCDPDPADAVAIAEACGQRALAHVPGFYRVQPPLAPWSATLAGEASPPTVKEIHRLLVDTGAGAELVLVEGAGGVCVPLNATDDVIDIAREGGWPVLLVASDSLGTLSHTLTAVEALGTRGIELLGIALVKQNEELSQETNLRVLQARLSCSVWPLGPWRVPQNAAVDQSFDALYRRVAASIIP